MKPCFISSVDVIDYVAMVYSWPYCLHSDLLQTHVISIFAKRYVYKMYMKFYPHPPSVWFVCSQIVDRP